MQSLTSIRQERVFGPGWMNPCLMSVSKGTDSPRSAEDVVLTATGFRSISGRSWTFVAVVGKTDKVFVETCREAIEG